MWIDGYGGRAGNLRNETLNVLAGLLFIEKRELLPVSSCANPKCGRSFRPRAEGDDYCNERCDPLNKFRGFEVRSED